MPKSSSATAAPAPATVVDLVSAGPILIATASEMADLLENDLGGMTLNLDGTCIKCIAD